MIAVLLFSALQQMVGPDALGERRTARSASAHAEADSATRALIALARRARSAQDSALRGYDAKTRSRITVNIGTSALRRKALLFQTENVSLVRWRRSQGMWIEPVASRTTAPNGSRESVSGVAHALIPVPYFPGRDQLWLPTGELGGFSTGVSRSAGFLHPLAEGSDAFYRFQIGDSLRIRLANGDGITIRELKVRARRADWRAFVGSFWFDVRSGALVRAAYRLSAPLELWDEAIATANRELAEAERDSSTTRDYRLRDAKAQMPGRWLRLLTPLRLELTLVTVEYALHEGRFWLPRRNRAEAEQRTGFVHLPASIEESYTYEDVDGTSPLPPLPSLDSARFTSGSLEVCTPRCEAIANDPEIDAVVTRVRRRQLTDSLLLAHGYAPVGGSDTTQAAVQRQARGDTLFFAYRYALLEGQRIARTQVRDSLLVAAGYTLPAVMDSSRAAGRVRAVGDSLYRTMTHRNQRRVRDAECAATGGFFTRTEVRQQGALRYGLKLPCDSTALARSPELGQSPGSAPAADLSPSDVTALVRSLGLDLQPEFAPRAPRVDWSLSQQRYNRVEGFSFGSTVTWPLGAGYSAVGAFRLGVADWQPNAEVRVERSNGRTTVRGAVYRRLNAANDFGDPLSFGASLAVLAYGRDEGFYYRSAGAAVSWEAQRATGWLRWRFFAEHHTEAVKRWNFNLLDLAGGQHQMLANITARRTGVAGGAAEWHTEIGVDRRGWRFAADVRAEAAGGGASYARTLSEITVSRPVGAWVTAAQTVSAGVATKDVPAQRQFYMGGLRTVRGQNAGEQAGNAYWLSRSEVALGTEVLRPSLFLDVGWAGAHTTIASPGATMSGLGVGATLLNGLARVDVSRGLRPERRVRIDFSLGARF